MIVLSNNGSVAAHTVANGLAAIALRERYEMPRTKQPLSLSRTELHEFEGDYRLRAGELRRVARHNNTLSIQRGAGPVLRLLPETHQTFYFAHDPMTTITFLRDSTGSVFAHTVTQAFDQDTAWLVAENGGRDESGH